MVALMGGKVKVLRLDQRSGLIKARMAGAAYSTGEVFHFHFHFQFYMKNSIFFDPSIIIFTNVRRAKGRAKNYKLEPFYSHTYLIYYITLYKDTD